MTFSVHGLSAGLGGVAIGRAVRVTSGRANVAHYFIAPEQVEAEINRLREAKEALLADMHRLQASLAGSLYKDTPPEISAIMDVHMMLLQDETLSDGVKHWVVDRHYNAEWALTMQLEVIASQFDEMHDEYMRERKGDLEQVVERLLQKLHGTESLAIHTRAQESNTDPLVLVAHDLSPAEMIHFKSGVFQGFVTDVGGRTSHTVIVAHSLGIPAVVGAKNVSQLVRQDDWVIVDADAGVLVVNPSESIIQSYRKKQALGLAAHNELEQAAMQQAIVRAPDGTPVTVLANIELPTDTAGALAAGAQGVGLFRTEFLFMGRTQLPDEEEQYAAYRDVVMSMRGLPVTIRTIDVGADKQLDKSFSKNQQYQINPALGLRAIRWCLAEPVMFLTQLRALLRAAAHGRIEVLIPMLAHEREIKQCMLMVDRARLQLDARSISYGDIGLGAMIEVPAAALIVPTFLRYFDFLCIGTNDLTQYTLAVDRTDESVAHLYDPSHPAVQFLIESTIKQCVLANKSVSVCGEMAGDISHAKALMGMGLRCFSMHPSQIITFKKHVESLRN